MVKIELGLDMAPPGKTRFGNSMWMLNDLLNDYIIEYNKRKLKEERLKKLKKLNNYE